ncbi:MAG: cyclic nucleotide-binding domain-containing protein [Magnetococcales bacterium]|nr:cyclic nucleotide-binding domain-containing protein [Magnetococcales bacterium]
MRQNQLGRLYHDGDIIVRKGDKGDCMFLLQKGKLEVVIGANEDRVVATLDSGDFFGEMSLFTGEPRSATVRSHGESRVLTIDEPAFIHRLRMDPMLAFHVLKTMYHRLRGLNRQRAGYAGYQWGLSELDPSSS